MFQLIFPCLESKQHYLQFQVIEKIQCVRVRPQPLYGQVAQLSTQTCKHMRSGSDCWHVLVGKTVSGPEFIRPNGIALAAKFTLPSSTMKSLALTTGAFSMTVIHLIWSSFDGVRITCKCRMFQPQVWWFQLALVWIAFETSIPHPISGWEIFAASDHI